MIHSKTLIAAAVAFALPALAQTQGSSPATGPTAMAPAQFVQTAAVANMFEIQSSRLALERAQTPAVKQFAQEMIKDHTDAATKLKAAARKASADIQVPTALDQEHKQKLDELTQQKGSQFEQGYINAQVQAHDQAVVLFTAYSTGGTQPDLKAFAMETLPTLQHHQAEVNKLKE